MTPSILRMVLIVAVILGVGVVLNLFRGQEQYGRLNQAGPVPAQPVAIDRGRTTTKQSRAANAKRLLGAVRRELQSRGYLTAAAGGPIDVATHAAILAFEDDFDLSLTATPSNGILKALVFTPTATGGNRRRVPETEVARELIGEVQRALAHLGYGQPDITTELDNETRRAIRKFERARGLQVSGRVSAPLIVSLGPAFDAARVGSANNGTDPSAG